MIKSTKIIFLWKWAILSMAVLLIMFFMTAPMSEHNLEITHLIVSFLLIVNAIVVIFIPLVASFVMKKSFLFAFFIVLLFNIIGSVILFFIYRRAGRDVSLYS